MEIINPTENTIHSPPSASNFIEKTVQDIQDAFNTLLVNIGEPIPMLVSLKLNPNFAGTLTYLEPQNCFFITSNQLIADRYTGEILRHELRLTANEYHSIRYSASAPNLETMVRIRAVAMPRPEMGDQKSINRLLTVNKMVGAFNQWFPTITPVQAAKTEHISRTTAHNILNTTSPGSISLSAFLKLITAACEIHDRDTQTVWEDILNG